MFGFQGIDMILVQILGKNSIPLILWNSSLMFKFTCLRNQSLNRCSGIACMLILFVDDRIEHYKSWVEGLNRSCCLQSIFLQPATARLASRSTRHGELACLRDPGWELRGAAVTCGEAAGTCGEAAVTCGSLRQGAATPHGILSSLGKLTKTLSTPFSSRVEVVLWP
jgi:hypothetical protein